MRDWWQPTKANFFGHLKKPQIIAALNEAGLSGAARDAEKMKKGDAAEHAEFHMKDNRWVPGWMCAPHPQTDAIERTDNLADAAWFVRATLEAHGMGVGNESPSAPPETMPDIQTRELVMLIKRLASSLKAVKPDSSVVREAQDWLCDRKLVDITDILR